MPDVAITAALVNALDNRFDRIDLIWAHHQQLFLAGYQHHVAADHLPQHAFGEKGVGEAVQMGDLAVVFSGKKRSSALKLKWRLLLLAKYQVSERLLTMNNNLHHRHAVDQQDHVIAVVAVAVVGADALLVDHLEAVFLAQVLGGRKGIGRDDGLQQAGEFAISQMNAVERLEVLAKVVLQRGAVADIRTVGVLESSLETRSYSI